MNRVWVGLDYGRKRIGLAVATALGTVHPRPRLDRTTREADMDALCDLAREVSAYGFIVGLPHNMDGSSSAIEEEVRQFAAVLAVSSGLPVFGCDERLSTEAADTILRNQERHWRDRKERRDSAAACIVLQDFLSAGEEGERLA